MQANKKIVILGFGHLMEYLRPCYLAYLGEHAKTNLVATTVDAEHYQEKVQENEFTILLNDNETALQTEPTVIFFAPPPCVAKELCETTLLPYFQNLRMEGKPLPALYVFPPSPDITYYVKTLGEDVLAVAILPNMTQTIAGRNVAAEGYSLLTFPAGYPWPADRLEELKQIFQPLGGTLELQSTQTIAVLACSVACNVFCDVIHDLEQVIGQGQRKAQQIAAAMRKHLYSQYPPRVSEVMPYTYEGLRPDQQYAAETVCENWFAGLANFLRDFQMEKTKQEAFLAQRLDSFLQMTQAMPRSDIESMREKRATPGGALDSGLKAYQKRRIALRQVLSDIVTAHRGGEAAQATTSLYRMAQEIAAEVYAHSVQMG